MTKEFKREDRYLVLKRKDLEKLNAYVVHQLDDWIEKAAPYLPKRQYVVVESDWPEYETVFKMIEERVTGNPVVELASLAGFEEVKKLREQLSDKCYDFEGVVIQRNQALAKVEKLRRELKAERYVCEQVGGPELVQEEEGNIEIPWVKKMQVEQARREGLFIDLVAEQGPGFIEEMVNPPLSEAVAKVVYEQWSDQPGYKPWVSGGNATKQDEARAIARKALAAAIWRTT